MTEYEVSVKVTVKLKEEDGSFSRSFDAGTIEGKHIEDDQMILDALDKAKASVALAAKQRKEQKQLRG